MNSDTDSEKYDDGFNQFIFQFSCCKKNTPIVHEYLEYVDAGESVGFAYSYELFLHKEGADLENAEWETTYECGSGRSALKEIKVFEFCDCKTKTIKIEVDYDEECSCFYTSELQTLTKSNVLTEFEYVDPWCDLEIPKDTDRLFYRFSFTPL